MKQKRRNK